MKQVIAVWCAAVFGLSLLAGPAHAARADAGTSGAAFLKLNTGARPAGMGESFTGIADDAHALFYNPAGLAGIDRSEFTAQYGSWFQGIAYNALGVVFPAGRSRGSFGIGVVNLGVSDIERRTADTAESEGFFGGSDYAYLLSYGVRIMPVLSAGLTAKVVNQQLDTRSATALAADCGLLWSTPVDRLTAGIVAQNIGQRIALARTASPLPLTIKAGLGYRLLLDKTGMLFGMDISMPRDNDLILSAGAEARRDFSDEFSGSLRAGYRTVTQEKLGGLSGLTAGAGIAWKQFMFDCAWVPYGDLGDTFRYSMSVKF